jgi:TRAP transporter TAXI family solute receptor
MKVFRSALAVAVLLLFGTAAFAATVQLNFSTGSMGGGFYAIGGGLADFVTKNAPGVEVTAVTSGGVNENINRLDSGQAEIGMLNTIDPPLAFEGKAPYKKAFNKMRGMGILYLQYGQPYTLASTGIKTYLDLRERSSVQGPRRLHAPAVLRLGRAHGLDPEKDFKKVVYLPAREAMEALKAGRWTPSWKSRPFPHPQSPSLPLPMTWCSSPSPQASGTS